jgi:BolA family transcriptional regulator, general stress-responsive regulator
MSTAERIREKLQALAPQRLEIEDESARHAGHAGAQSGGGHYQLLIVSPAFAGKTKIARHRLVYAALGDMMHKEIHALSIQALDPDEL